MRIRKKVEERECKMRWERESRERGKERVGGE